jgi:hypothetical protein
MVTGPEPVPLVPVAVTVIVADPGVVGVPVMTHPALVSVRPPGIVPVSVQVYGPVPPVTPIGPVYGVPTVAGGGEVMVSVDVAALITRETGPVVVSAGLLESVAVIVRDVVAAVVGFPVMVQLAIERPAGNGVLADSAQV